SAGRCHVQYFSLIHTNLWTLWMNTVQAELSPGQLLRLLNKPLGRRQRTAQEAGTIRHAYATSPPRSRPGHVFRVRRTGAWRSRTFYTAAWPREAARIPRRREGR